MFSSSLKELNAAQILEKISRYGLSEAQQLELIKEYATNKESYKTTESIQALSAAQKEATTSTLGLGAAYKGLAASLGLTVTQLNIFLGIAVAAGAALYALHEYSQRMDRLSEAAAESIEEYNKLDSEIKDVNDELKTTHKRIEELEKQDNLTFVEQEELERLKSTNDELERSLPLLKAKRQSQEGKTRDSVLRYLTENSEYTQYNGTLNDAEWAEKKANYGSTAFSYETKTFKGTPVEIARAQLKEYEALKDDYVKIQEEMLVLQEQDPIGFSVDFHYQTLDTQLSDIDQKMSDIVLKASEYNKELGDGLPFLNVGTDKGLIDDIKAFQAEFDTFYKSLETYSATQSFNKIWNAASFKSVKEELTALSKAGELTPEKLKSQKRYTILLDETGKTAEEVAAHINRLVENMNGIPADPFKISTSSRSEALSKVNSLTDGFKDLADVYNSIRSKEGLNFTLLNDDFAKVFSNTGEAYQNFIDTITTSPKDIDACQEAFDQLIYVWLQTEDVLDLLNDDTVGLIGSMLEEQGVVDATSWLMDELEARKIYAADATLDLANATVNEISAFIDEKNASDEVSAALTRLALGKIATNEAALSTTGDIENLIALAEQANATKTALQDLKNYQTLSSSANATVGDEVLSSDLENSRKKVQKTLQSPSSYIVSQGKGGATNSGGYRPKSNDSKSKSPNSKKEKKDPTTFDWMERRIKDLDSQIDNLKTNIDTLVGYEGKNRATDSAIDLMRIKLEDLGKMYDAYMEKANSFGLSEEYAVKVREGTISIEEIDPNNKANEALIEQIKNYQDWYEKAIDCKNQITETTEAIKTLNLSKLDNIIDQFDTLADVQSQIIDTEQQLLDLREKQGEAIEADDYISLAEKQLESTRLNIEAYNRLSAEMAKLNLERGTEEWKKYNDQLQDLKNNMISAADAVEDYKDAMTALVYKDLNDFKNRMDSINGTIDTMSNLIGNTNLVDDDGLLTDRGLAQMALYAQQLSNARQEAAEYDEAIRSLDDAYDSGLITQDEYNSMLYEYKSAQESAVSATKAARDAILALVKEGIQAEIDAKKKLVDETKAALDAERDLHEYQQSIADKQGNISKLQRQIAALSNSTDRKDIAQKLQLQQQLADAQKDLFETQYDHELEQRKEALDDEYEAFEESKNKEMDELDSNLDKQEGAINKYLEEVKKNHSTAYEILKQYGEEYNLTATDDLTNPWKSAGSAADLCSDAIGNVTANIQYEIDNLDFDSLYELIDLLNSIGEYGYGDGDATASQWEDISGTGKWHKSEQSGRWWYGSDEDNYASGGIYTINGKQYGFNDKGQMVTGWRNDIGDGTWRYFEPENGQMIRSTWRKSKTGEWYYLDKNGAMATNMAIKAKNEDGYYYVDEDGKMEEGLLSYEDVKRLGYKIGYKGGTRSATAGWHRIDEEGIGSETIITKDGQVLHPFRGDETVFSKANTNVLWDFTNNPSGFINGAIKNEPRANVEPVSQNVSVEMNIGGVLDEAAARVLSEQFPAMIKKNIKNISDGVANQVKWQLKGR